MPTRRRASLHTLLAMTTHLTRLAAGFHIGSVSAATAMTTNARPSARLMTPHLRWVVKSGAEGAATRVPSQSRCPGLAGSTPRPCAGWHQSSEREAIQGDRWFRQRAVAREQRLETSNPKIG